MVVSEVCLRKRSDLKSIEVDLTEMHQKELTTIVSFLRVLTHRRCRPLRLDEAHHGAGELVDVARLGRDSLSPATSRFVVRAAAPRTHSNVLTERLFHTGHVAKGTYTLSAATSGE